MQLSSVLTPISDENLRLASQCGVTEIVTRYPGENLLRLAEAQQRFARFGLRLSVVEGYLPIENIKIGSTQQAITIKSLNGIKLVSPSYAVHEKFTQIVEPLYKKHRANIKQNKALSTLRDTLLPKLLSGEIELGQAQELAEVE